MAKRARTYYKGPRFDPGWRRFFSKAFWHVAHKVLILDLIFHFLHHTTVLCVCGCPNYLSPFSVHSLLLSSHGGCIQRGDTSPLPPLPHPHHFHPSPEMKRGRGEGGATPSLSPSQIIIHPLPHMHTTDPVRDLEGRKVWLLTCTYMYQHYYALCMYTRCHKDRAKSQWSDQCKCGKSEF